jgi:hypothetical protein
MNDDSETGSSGSSYISYGSCTYTIYIPDPSIIFIEWFPEVPRLGILLQQKNQDSTFPSFSDRTDTDTTVDTVEREDILDMKRWHSHCSILNLPGGAFQHQTFLYVKHIHHPKAFRVSTPSSYGYVSHGLLHHCNKLIILQGLRSCPEDIWIDNPTQRYIENIKRNRLHCYNCNDMYGPKRKHWHRRGYNCKTLYPFKHHSNVAKSSCR